MHRSASWFRRRVRPDTGRRAWPLPGLGGTRIRFGAASSGERDGKERQFRHAGNRGKNLTCKILRCSSFADRGQAQRDLTDKILRHLLLPRDSGILFSMRAGARTDGGLNWQGIQSETGRNGRTAYLTILYFTTACNYWQGFLGHLSPNCRKVTTVTG